MEPPQPELIERFRADYERLMAASGSPDQRIAVAVSGGPDSMAMLGLASAAFPSRVVAATVDHGLRKGSDQEASMVAGACRTMGVPHATLSIEVPPEASGNLHDWARQERYILLMRWATDAQASILCTAHHAEDQAETFLMRAARATGLSGLAAVRARVETSVSIREQTRIVRSGPDTYIEVTRRPITLLRPLLRWRRAELRAVVRQMEIPFVDDPSNQDARFDRTHFRQWLEDAPWIDPVQVGRTAEHLAALDADLREVTQWLWRERVVQAGDFDVKFDVAGLPRGVTRYLVRMAINHIHMMNGMDAGNWGPASNVESLLDALERGSSATQANVLASAQRTIWHFREAPPRRSH